MLKYVVLSRRSVLLNPTFFETCLCFIHTFHLVKVGQGIGAYDKTIIAP